MRREEQNEQIALIKWCDMMGAVHPELRRIYHIPNGGKRTKVEAMIFKAMGVRSGVPDLCLPVPRGDLHGLYIELKADKGRPSPNQLDWVEYLISQGYQAAICQGWVQAAHEICEYLGLSKKDDPSFS